MAETLTPSAWAKLRGHDPKRVLKAIRTGRLTSACVRYEKGSPRIFDSDIAQREWFENGDFSHSPERSEPPAAVTAGPPEGPVDDDDFDDIPVTILPSAKEGMTLAQASAVDKIWKAQMTELKYRQAAGELLPVKEAETRIADLVNAFKTRLLGIPTRIRQVDPSFTAAQLELVKSLIREALEERIELADDVGAA